MLVTIKCGNCGEDVHLPPSRLKNGAKYCSSKCYHEAKTAARVVSRGCQQCGTTFKKRLSQVVRGKGLYCSTDCARLGSRMDRVERPCGHCGKPLIVVPEQVAYRDNGRGQYCSMACSGAAKTLEGTMLTPCKRCGDDVRVHRSKIEDGRKSYCSDECKAADKLREERPCEHCGAVMVLIHTKTIEERRFCGRECYKLNQAKDPAILERLAVIRAKQLEQKEPTRCERILYELMDRAVGPKAWESQYRLFHWTVDAAVPGRQLVVQADGDYWHGLTAAKAGEAPHPTVALTISKDRAQDKYLEKAGWRILRLWESELIKNSDWCLRRITAAIEEAGGDSGKSSA
ncbi:DUF559 domain-containing protein [Kitasatospora sp. NPDC053057]|uniref:endonuclease domain-containing protein n=1 Tax=Kitasatospora sp. NPDC053057 TaxID=3364062 RepID=UPI0037CA52BA